MDQEDAVYDTEVQKRNTRNLPKRSRLYHGMIDSGLLPAGTIDYNQLPDSYVIMITPFDPVGQGLFRYTFQMMCKELPGVTLEDGATRIFLNTRGTARDDADQELVELLRYFERTTEDQAARSGSEKIQAMHRVVEEIRSSEEIGVRYMQQWEEKALARQEAREEGRKSGIEEGRKSGIEENRRAIALEMKKDGMEPEQIARLTKLPLEEIEKLLI